MVGYFALKNGLQFMERQSLENVARVYNLLEIFKLLNTAEDRRKFLVIDSTIVQNNSINVCISKKCTSFSQCLAMADTQCVTS